MTCVTFDKSSPSYPSALLPTSAVPSSIRTPPGQFFHRQSQYQHKCLPLSWEMLSNWGDWEEAGEKSGRGVAFTCLCFFICFFHLSCLPNSLPLSLSLSLSLTHTHILACLLSFTQKDTHTPPEYHFWAEIQSLLLSEIHCAFASWQSLQTAQWVFL